MFLSRSPLFRLTVSALLLSACGVEAQERQGDPEQAERRRAMVEQIESYGVRDSATLAAMRAVPRHEFVPGRYRDRAYGDHPLPIGHGQTISQPYIVAYMTEILELEPGMKVLEIGTGSGYQAAVLAEIGCDVYTMEIFGALAESARERLGRLAYDSVEVRHGDGHYGWPEAAPFEAIIVTAAAGHIPPALVDQLEVGGRMVIPVGSVYGVQNLILVTKRDEGEVRTRNLLPVRFVPMLEGLR
ncbi:MAG: protein-L-isoaspartate(D-aspartate) O-methyltransferase [Gemmatimonadetes bacterium]|uniref:Protein-L-isoaspartate O-methyltransferase n=1 Tax=Candidatus Kutchimonas denitrificans TaxID=3056748 RepID=A0AAE4ZBF3_9BACT|nr:protein-L-isoaspartate(D-aspartate) O-methyltransferase [Gemmatimonadota bacterium]NIR74395.1 protein-L-isoaspartate(D-aspartate) O-methyltransferase [Candidatus Kutchimonas denitrificans]NIS02646.1 protein-L-isoaspartate(D-aspartate) O-methyltransferase [Gemmatimonadota bacterium]NIT68521.1 protein-L-isoaspartate(D-aspartate) O-methyltransferase [Gemmatimonadota bacterium]NIU51998.1 protein-L-isoaspartate(D-aspartate) O-methyltransferase [Gemmatimonadota bacterium]